MGRVAMSGACKAAAMALMLLACTFAGAAEPPAQPATAAAGGANGEQVYARWCVHCHDSGRGNPGTDSLRVKYRDSLPAVLLERTDLTAEAVSTFVRQGVLSMPPFRKTEITDAELAALAAYVARNTARR